MPGSAVKRLDLPKEEKYLIILIVIDMFSLKGAIHRYRYRKLYSSLKGNSVSTVHRPHASIHATSFMSVRGNTRQQIGEKFTPACVTGPEKHTGSVRSLRAQNCPKTVC